MHTRLEQEAKSIPALQHPIICVVHDIGTQGGIDFMVLEYVSGKTSTNDTSGEMANSRGDPLFSQSN